MEKETLHKLAYYAATKQGYNSEKLGNFSREDVDEVLRAEFQKIAGSINRFNQHKYDIYEIISVVATEVLPQRVIETMGQFAEVQTVGQGQKVIFRKKLGKLRAKQFITEVGLSGVYETFRLDTTTFEVPTKAIGGGIRLNFERMLDGYETMADLMDIINEGLVDAVMGEVQQALHAAIDNVARPANNKVTANKFDAAAMVKLVNTVKAYGTGAAIFATPEFIASMGPDAIVPGTTAYQGVYSMADIDAIHQTGLINLFRGTPVVQIPQSFVDESNTEKVIDPHYAYVFPTGGEKIVKVAFEGPTQVYDAQNRDNSYEMYVYQKVGTAILTHHNWGIYKNTAEM